jgi:hypothetical protein
MRACVWGRTRAYASLCTRVTVTVRSLGRLCYTIVGGWAYRAARCAARVRATLARAVGQLQRHKPALHRRSQLRERSEIAVAGVRYLLIADVHTESRVLPAAVLCAQGQPWERIDFQALLATGLPAEVAAWHTFDVTPGAAPPDGLYLWLRVDVTAESQIDCMQTVTSWPLMFVPFRSMVPQEPSSVCTTADGPMRVYIGVSDTASFAPSYTFGVATRCALENRVTLYRLDYLCLYGHALRFPRLPWRTPGAA